MFEIPAALLSLFYGFTTSYTLAIGLMAVVVIVITTPLTLKSTRGTLAMQRLEPEMRRLQNEYRRRPRQAQRRDDEALPGAQDQSGRRRFCRWWRRLRCSSSCSVFCAV